MQRVRSIKEELIDNIALDYSTNQKWAFGGMPKLVETTGLQNFEEQ